MDGNRTIVKLQKEGSLCGLVVGFLTVLALVGMTGNAAFSQTIIENFEVVGADASSTGPAEEGHGYWRNPQSISGDYLFRNNSATGGSGFVSSLFEWNGADGKGGIIYLDNHFFSLDGSVTFSSNMAEGGDANGASASGLGYGGAIYSQESSFLIGGLTQFNNNFADDGGALYVVGNSQGGPSSSPINTGEGGPSASFSLDGTTTFSSNSAFGSGGAVYANNTTFSASGSTLYSGNTASVGSGGAIYAELSTISLDGMTTFGGNWANFGGAIYADSTEIILDGTTVFGGNMAAAGGAILATDSTVSATGTTLFSGNMVTGSGGAILAESATIDLGGTTDFDNNEANFGGAIFASDDSEITISGTATFGDNRAATDGGAIFVTNSTITLSPTTGNSITFTDNLASGSPNAIHMAENVLLELNPEVGATIVFNDPISSSGFDNRVVQTGSGTVRFHGSSAFDGVTQVTNGVFSIEDGATYGVVNMFNARNEFTVGDMTGTSGGIQTGTRPSGTVVLGNNSMLAARDIYVTGGGQLRFAGSSAILSANSISIESADNVYYQGISKDGTVISVIAGGTLAPVDHSMVFDENPFANKAWLNVDHDNVLNVYTVTPKSLVSLGEAADYSEVGLRMLADADRERNAAVGTDRVMWDDWYNSRYGGELSGDPGYSIAPVEMLNSLILTRGIGQVVFWRQKEQNKPTSSLVAAPLVRGQKNRNYDLYFQTFAANAHVWSRTDGREGYGITRNGGIVGLNTDLTDKMAGGVVLGFSVPYFYDSREKIDLTDFQFGAHLEAQLDKDWEAAFYIGGGAQHGNTFRNANAFGNWYNFHGDYCGNTLTSTLTLSKVLRLSEQTALRPTMAVDMEHAWFYNFTEEAAQTLGDRMGGAPVLDLNLARRNFLRSHYDRTMLRIGVMGQTNSDHGGINARFFYSPQIGGLTVASTRLTLVEGPIAGQTYKIDALPLGREFVTLGVGGHVFLNKKKTLTLFGDYNANLFARATTQIGSLGAQYSF